MVCLAIRYVKTVRGSDPGRGEIFLTPPDRPWGPSILLDNECRVSLPGLKWPGCGVDHPPQSSSEVAEIVELHFCSHPELSWPIVW